MKRSSFAWFARIRIALAPADGTAPVFQQAAWLAMAAVAFVGLPWVWSAALVRWLQFGVAAWKWPAATMALAAITALLCRAIGGPPRRRAGRRALLFFFAAWCAAHAVCWHWRVSPLGDDPRVMLAYLGSTIWLGGCMAMLCTSLAWSSRLRRFAVSLLPLAAWFAGVEMRGADGFGRPLVAWRASNLAPSATPDRRMETISSDEAAAKVGIPGEPTTKAAATGGDDYPCFRGHHGMASLEGVRLAPNWSSRPPRLVWRMRVGGGSSGFVVSGARAYTQEQHGNQETIVCYELATGHECWSHADAACFRSAMGGDGPRATPAVADGYVYSLGATGILNCLDAATGRHCWSVDVLADNGASNLLHGLSGSPLTVGAAVVVSVGGAHGRSLAAYDRRTGERLFRGGDDPAAYGSPLLSSFAEQRQVVVFNRPGLAAHDPETGDVLWTFPWSNNQETNCSQPLPVGGDRILVSTGYGKGCALVAVQCANGRWTAEALWTSRGLKCKFSSPVVRAGFVYGLDDGVLACLDLADGRRCWRAGRYGHGQLLLVGDLLLIQAESGEVVLVAATPQKHRELGRFAALDGKTWNYPALAGRWLVVRNDHEAACYELPTEVAEGLDPGV